MKDIKKNKKLKIILLLKNLNINIRNLNLKKYKVLVYRKKIFEKNKNKENNRLFKIKMDQ